MVPALIAIWGGAAGAQDAKAALDAAASALGATNLKTIQYSGWGSDFMFGQGYDGNAPWPRFHLPSYSMTVDFTTPAMRDERRRAQVENPPLGGGFQPLVGEIRQIWAMSGPYAWDVAGQNAVPAAAERDLRPAVEGRTTQIWLTPHGFVKAALSSGNATAKADMVRGAKKTVISFTTPSKVRLEGVLNDRNLVEHIETWLASPLLGDMKFEAAFSGYKDFGGVKFPTRIQQREGGYPVLDVTITDVMPNASVTIEVPANVKQSSAAPTALPAEKLSDGVWMIPGNAKSVIVEFRDYVAVVDAPENEMRSIAVIDAIKKVIPSKPIRYVINTHSHIDHAGGLRTYAAEGATVITHHANIPYYQAMWANPRTINPDRLAKSGRTPVFEGVVGNRTLTDGSRELAIYHYAGNMHNPGMLMVYLPKEKLLIEADSFNPPANPSDPPAGMPNLVHFYDSVERLRLDVDQIVPIHGRLVTLEDVRSAVERYGRTQLWAK